MILKINVCCFIYVYVLFLFFLVVLHRDKISVDRFSESPVTTQASVLHYCLGNIVSAFMFHRSSIVQACAGHVIVLVEYNATQMCDVWFVRRIVGLVFL